MAMLPIALLWRDLGPAMRIGVVFGAAWIVFAVWNSARVARESRPALDELEQAIDDAAEAGREYARRADHAPSRAPASPRTDPARTTLRIVRPPPPELAPEPPRDPAPDRAAPRAESRPAQLPS